MNPKFKNQINTYRAGRTVHCANSNDLARALAGVVYGLATGVKPEVIIDNYMYAEFYRSKEEDQINFLKVAMDNPRVYEEVAYRALMERVSSGQIQKRIVNHWIGYIQVTLDKKRDWETESIESSNNSGPIAFTSRKRMQKYIRDFICPVVAVRKIWEIVDFDKDFDDAEKAFFGSDEF